MNKFSPHEKPGNIFMQPWWLDVVAKGKWSDLTIEKGGGIIARWPIVKSDTGFFNSIYMPVLTQKLGPWIKYNSNKQENINSHQKSVLFELIQKLPAYDKLVLKLNQEVENFLPFVWQGFKQESVTTYQISHPIDESTSWENLKSAVRRDIKKAEQELTLETEVKASEAFILISETFERQGKKTPYSEELFVNLISAAEERGRMSLLAAKDSSGSLVGTCLFIHDDTVTYYLAGGYSRESSTPGIVSYLIWNGIKLASQYGHTFDFEGSSIPSVEKYFSSFGAIPTHYHKITGLSKRYAVYYYAKQLMNHLKR